MGLASQGETGPWLLLQDGEEYCLDGLGYSSVGRFLNHSCAPNLVPVRVAMGHEIPGIAFFTNRPVQAGEELG